MPLSRKSYSLLFVGTFSLEFGSVRHRPHHVQVSLKNEAPAYLGEEFPITLDVTNIDDRELDISVDILLQPTEIEEAG